MKVEFQINFVGEKKMNSSLKDYQGSSIPPLPNRFYSVKTFLQNHD